MKQWVRWIWAGFLVWGAAASALDFQLVTELDRFEPFDAHVFHDGRLWVGRSRKDLAAHYRLEIYDASGKRLEEKTLTHSLRYLYPYGKDGVLTLGVSVTDNLTHFSTIVRKGNQYKVTTRKIPLGAYGNEWGGKPGLNLFTDPGGFDDGGPLDQPLPTLFTLGSSYRYLKARIRHPKYPILVGDRLYVVENPSIGLGGRFLGRVDLKKETYDRLLPADGIAYQMAVDGGRLLALAVRDTSEVILFDTKTEKEAGRIAVGAAYPRALAQLNHCLLVGTEESKEVTFVDLRTLKTVGKWDLSVGGPKLYGLWSLAADPQTGTIFARSNYPASVVEPSSPDRNSVMSFREADGATAARCR